MTRTQKTINIGLLVALSIVLTRMFSFYPVPTIRISFGDIPIMLSGMIMGPWAGAITGAMSDLIGVVLLPAPGGGGYFPGFTLSKALVGVIPALVVMFYRKPGFIRVAIAVVLTEVICSLGLDTIWLSILYKKGIFILLPSRLVTRSVIAVVEIPAIFAILTALKKVVNVDEG